MYVTSKKLAKLYTEFLSERQIATAWTDAKMIFKKGTKKDLKNYRPICLLLNINKVLTQVLTKKLEKTLDENLPREQAGFRSGYSITDHIHVVNQLKEKCREYNTPLCIAFVNYKKAFDSMQTRFKNIGWKMCTSNSWRISTPTVNNSPSIQRKQQNQHQEGSTAGRYHIAQTALESIFRRLTWDTRDAH